MIDAKGLSDRGAGVTGARKNRAEATLDLKSSRETLYGFFIGPRARAVHGKGSGVRSSRQDFRLVRGSRTREEVTHLTITEAVGGKAPATAQVAVTLVPDLTAAQIAEAVVTSLDDSKAEDIVTIDIADKSSLADLMIVASGRSHRHVGAIADRLIDDLAKLGMHEERIEGLPHCDWVLIDLGDVLVHLFRPEVRGFYALEKMWAAEPDTAKKPAAKA